MLRRGRGALQGRGELGGELVLKVALSFGALV